MARGVSALAKMALTAGRQKDDGDGRDVVDIITFCEAEWGLGMRLYPVQKVILKAFYGIALDNNPANRFTITDWRRENPRQFTEAEYLAYLFAEGRCNLKEVIPGQERGQMVLSIGRRSGKSLLSSCIAAYETYKLINKGNPQRYYGLSPSSTIQLIAVATGKDQAGLLYKEVQGHFLRCSFFRRYLANSTESFARFQTPNDIEEFGPCEDNPKSRASIKATFHACNAKTLRGAGNIVAILDEVAHFVNEGGSSAEDVYQAINPSTGTFSPKNALGEPLYGPMTQSDGKIILISSPLGKQGLFYQKFRQGMENGALAGNILCVQAPTWEVNPTIPADVFFNSYAEDSRIFFTEWGGEFTDRRLGWLEDPKDLFECIDPQHRPRTHGQPRRPHFVGFDLGLGTDGSAIAITHIDDQSRIVLDFIGKMQAGEGLFADREHLDFDDIAEWIFGLSRRFTIHKGLFDHYGGIILEQALAKKGLTQFEGKRFSDMENSEIWQNLKTLIWERDRVNRKPRLVLFDITPEEQAQYEARGDEPPDHYEYISELISLQAIYKSKYVIKVEAPQTKGKHDDLADALARSVWLASLHMGKPHHIAGTSAMRSSAQQQISQQVRAHNLRNRLLGGSDPKRQPPRSARTVGMLVKGRR